MCKRIFDFICSVGCLIVLSPILFISILLIWLEDRKSPFYIAPRVGLNGEYYIYKNRLRQTVNRETYAGIMDFTTDSTMTIQWDGGTAMLIFKRLPKKPQS